MTNLIICCDGTWNTPNQEDNGQPAPTNVFKLHGALADVDAAQSSQKAYYREGVGTSGNWWERIKGGGLGVGLSNDIISAYKWLCDNFAPGDSRIFLFGFSRGAYSVRSLAGLIGQFGVLTFDSEMTEALRWQSVKAIYDGYRSTDASKHKSADGLERHTNVEIEFLGVWDTVGALGIPDELFLNVLDRPRKYQFHSTTLGPKVRCARHAVAVDERRQTFSPTLWTEHSPDRDIEQRWFPGVHGDVGGGYAQKGLGDVALRWMIDEAEKHGLVFQKNVLAQISPSHQGVLHNSVTGLFEKLRTLPRSVPHIRSSNVHVAGQKRAKDPPIAQPHYWQTPTLSKGQTQLSDIFAGERWNTTGLFLEAGSTYELTASGEWLDANIRCTPDGPIEEDNWRKFFYRAAAMSDALQRRKRAQDGNKSAIVRGARREQDMPWFCLVGVIANGVGVDPTTQMLLPHETFKIGSAVTLKPEKSGYLYCFANDVWSFYFNNKGSVSLSVTRSG